MKSFIQFITELFDKPHESIPDSNFTAIARRSIPGNYHSTDSISAIRAFKLDGNQGHVIHLMRNGYFEVHHIDNDGRSGVLTNNMPTNPRFISTMVHHLKTHGLDKGHAIKVYGSPALQKHYDRIGSKILKHYPNHVLERSIENTKHGNLNSFIIRPKSKIEETIKELKKHN